MGFIRAGAAADPAPHQHFALVPRADYEIIDNWHAMAMKGSGTKTLKVHNVFVPEHRIESAKALMTGQSAGYGMYPDSTIFFAAYRPYFASGFSAVSLGIAEQMIRWFTERSKTRVRAYTGAEVGKDVATLRVNLARGQRSLVLVLDDLVRFCRIDDRRLGDSGRDVVLVPTIQGFRRCASYERQHCYQCECRSHEPQLIVIS